MLILYRFVLAGVSAVVFSLDQAAEAFAAIAAGEIRRRIEVDWLILHLRQDRCVKTDRLDTSTVRFVARIIGVETAEMLVNENLSHLLRAGNVWVRRGTIQLAWQFHNFQKDSALPRWFSVRAAHGHRAHARR